MDRQVFAEKCFTYLKNGVKLLALLPQIPSETKNIEIPLEVIYKRMQWAGWFKNDLSLSQQADLKKSIGVTYKEFVKTLPANKCLLFLRAKPEIEKLILENPDRLAKIEFDDQLCEVLNRPVNLEGEYLTPKDFDELTISFLNALRKNTDNSTFSDMLSRERIDDIWIFINGRISELEYRVTALENYNNYESTNEPCDNPIYTANSLYARVFEEVLFLHKYKEKGIRLCDVFVEHRYNIQEYIPRLESDEYGEYGEVETTIGILEYIKEFLVEHEKIPNILFIEGDAGSGKSSFISYLAYLYGLKSDIFLDKDLICIRLRDIIPPNTRFNYDSINSALLDYLQIDTQEAFRIRHSKSIVILDGFDELCMVERINENVDQCIYDLQKLFSDCKVIITSRPQYLRIQHLNLPNVHIVLQHFNSDQRKEWVAKYRKVSLDPDEKNVLEYIENIDDDSTEGICDTPMSLYLLAAGRINEDAKHNFWAMYNQIFSRELTETEYNSVFPSAIGVHRHAISKYSELLYRLSAEVAYKMYEGGNEKLYICETEIQEILDAMKISNVNTREIVARCYALSNYWKTNENRGAVEFYHNNIRDFFMCEKIFYEMDNLYEECQHIDNKEVVDKIVERLFALFRYSEISTKVVEFIYLRVLYQKEISAKGNFAKAEQKCKYLPRFFNTLSQIKIDASVEDAVYSIAIVYANVVQIYRHIYEPYIDGEDKLIDWMPDGGNYLVRKHILKDIFIKTPLTVNGKIIYTMGNGIFNNMDVYGADLRYAGFTGSSIRFSNLSNTALQSADFQGAVLNKTEFINADMRYANLLHCSLNGCDFSDANLANATLPDGFTSNDSTEVKEHLKSLKIDDIKV